MKNLTILFFLLLFVSCNSVSFESSGGMFISAKVKSKNISEVEFQRIVAVLSERINAYHPLNPQINSAYSSRTMTFNTTSAFG